MLKSSEIVLKFPDRDIPPFPIFDKDIHIRAMIGLHIEKTLFCDGNETKYKKNIPKLLSDLNITDKPIRKKIKEAVETYEEFLITLLEVLHKTAVTRVAEEGTFEYEAADYIYYDDDDDLYNIDLEKLQDDDAKFDNILLTVGQIIFIFNPTDKKRKLIVKVGDVKIREHEPSLGIQQLILQQIQCTCKQNPCTCGAVKPISAPDADDAEEYREWDTLMTKARDRDVILVYREGEEVMRF